MVRWLLIALGVYNSGVGLYAYALPQGFFEEVAAHTGPFNVHLMRDVGAAYLTAGAALLLAGSIARWRAPLALAAGSFLALHALIHSYEALSGMLDAHLVVAESFSVIAPAVLVCVLAARFVREERSGEPH